jgi:hypothetical protein
MKVLQNQKPSFAGSEAKTGLWRTGKNGLWRLRLQSPVFCVDALSWTGRNRVLKKKLGFTYSQGATCS